MDLSKAVFFLNVHQVAKKSETHVSDIDSRAILLVTIIYLVCLVSLPLNELAATIWFAIYPIIMAALSHERYEKIFSDSLYVLPIFIIIGIFNPIFDDRAAFKIGTYSISIGWITFLTLVIRGLLSTQALLILINIIGFIEFCNSLSKIGVPKVLTVQILMLYRYIGVILNEALWMHRARIARGFGRKNYPIGMWVQFIGLLFIRSLERSKRISMAMEARVFNGAFPIGESKKWETRDTVYCLSWIPVLIILRFFHIPNLIMQLAGFNL